MHNLCKGLHTCIDLSLLTCPTQVLLPETIHHGNYLIKYWSIVRPLVVFVRQISREQSIRSVDKLFAAGISRHLSKEVDLVFAELFLPFKIIFLVSIYSKWSNIFYRMTFGRGIPHLRLMHTTHDRDKDREWWVSN